MKAQADFTRGRKDLRSSEVLGENLKREVRQNRMGTAIPARMFSGAR